jgi:hypothetical protein
MMGSDVPGFRDILKTLTKAIREGRITPEKFVEMTTFWADEKLYRVYTGKSARKKAKPINPWRYQEALRLREIMDPDGFSRLLSHAEVGRRVGIGGGRVSEIESGNADPMHRKRKGEKADPGFRLPSHNDDVLADGWPEQYLQQERDRQDGSPLPQEPAEPQGSPDPKG